MTYSIIIPTMWFRNDCLLQMLEQYNKSKLVKEILIVNNRSKGYEPKVERFRKVRIINDGKNLFVNPSWNFGIEQAKGEKIVLANDDILIDNFNLLITMVDNFLERGQIIGADKMCFLQKRKTSPLPERDIVPVVTREYGYGTFMFMYKESYIPIPEEMKVWYGDTLLTLQLDCFAFRGIDIKTDMRSTSRRLPLREISISDREEFNRIVMNEEKLLKNLVI